MICYSVIRLVVGYGSRCRRLQSRREVMKYILRALNQWLQKIRGRAVTVAWTFSSLGVICFEIVFEPGELFSQRLEALVP